METFIAIRLGVSAAVALLIVAHGRRVNSGGNYWLGAFVATITAVLSVEVIFWDETDAALLVPDIVLGACVLLAPAFFLLAVLSFVRPLGKSGWRYWWLFVPFVLQLVVETAVVASYGLDFYLTDSPELVALFLAEDVLLNIYAAAAIGYALRLLRRHQSAVRRIRSDAEKADLGWLYGIILCVGLLLLANLSLMMSDQPALDWFGDIGILVAIGALGWFALGQEEIYPYPLAEKREIANIVTAPEPPSTANDPLYGDLLRLMEEERLYLDCSLSLPSLSNALNVRPQVLSAVISGSPRENFYQFVNSYRVEEAKRLLIDPEYDHLTMVGLAAAAGFSSKTTFNTSFKRVTGLSPSAFRAANRA